MKTASEWLDEASEQYDQANGADADDYYPHSGFIESAMESYATQVATRALQNAAKNAKIKCCGEEMFFKSVCIDSIIDPANIEL